MNKIQIVKCKCGATFAACLEPLCYTDKDWLKSIKEYLKLGYTIDYIERGKGLTFEKCKCNSQLKLF